LTWLEGNPWAGNPASLLQIKELASSDLVQMQLLGDDIPAIQRAYFEGRIQRHQHQEFRELDQISPSQ
jgi:hypothetical protein